METLNYRKFRDEFREIEKKERIEEKRNNTQDTKTTRTDKLINENKRDEFWEYLVKCK
jgi:hypothetical protein